MSPTHDGIPLGDVADRLAGLGLYVFPLRPGAKTPATTTGWKAATTNRDTVRKWWQRNPTMNVGIATEPSRLIVIDLDAGKPWPGPGPQPHGVTTGADVLVTIAQQHDAIGDGSWLFDTPSVRTPSGGTHLYYRKPDTVEVASTAGKVGPWIDVRARGGYVVAPWSHTPAGDYTPVTGWQPTYYAETDLTFTGDELNTTDERLLWLRLNPPPAPEWLLELVRVKPVHAEPADPWDALERALETAISNSTGYAAAALRHELTDLATAVEGTRNHQLNRAAFNLGTLIPHLDEETITRELAAMARDIGLTDHEASITIRSGIKAGRSNPRTVSP